MIRAVREWLLSIVMLSFLISLLRILLPEGSLRKVGAFTGSLVLMSAILRPLTRLEPAWPEWDMGAYERAVQERMEELNAAEEESFQAQVAERTAALIRAQAAELGLRCSVGVRTRMERGTPVPWSVSLDAARNAALSAWMETALGIPPARQYWTDTGETA